jgi:hypothetical protein
MRRILGRRPLALACIFTLLIAGSAWAAFQSLPSDGSQVNNDVAAGIDPTKPVQLADPTNADVVGGALTAGKPAVPWAIFQQTTSGHDQVFVRSFAAGAWTTRGIGTFGGQSSSSPTFSGSLNFDQTKDGESPSIDFAGTGRTVPWATWYEDTTAFGGKKQIFASRFDNTGDANQNKWIFAGQARNNSGLAVPSLNINPSEDAENPAIAGGSAANPTAPGPWVAWQEVGAHAPGTGQDQIFVVKPIGPGTTTCPAGTKPTTGTVGTVDGGFCWQQVGVERLGVDPSLNVDRTRAGIEPDIAFTGANDSVPWVVWYETGNSAVGGLHNNEMVFAAKGVAPSTTAPPTGTVDGGFNWIAVGTVGTGVLDASAGGGSCAASGSAEAACSLNVSPSAEAEDPRVAAGTMTAGNPTAPWVVWDEGSGTPNNNSVFVAHLVNGQFVIANSGNPIGTGDRADITFSGLTPYVTWHHNNQIVTGHFANPNSFIKDNAPVGTTALDTVRAPISSGCTANPFNSDGTACQGGAIGTPFFLYTDGNASTAKLFSDAYQTDVPLATAPTAVGTTTATLNATVNPQGGPVAVQFEFGPTTAYGNKTATQTIVPTDATTPFTASVTSLPSATTIHYRAVATTDFGNVDGTDQTLTTKTPPDTTPPKVTVKVLSFKLSRKHHKTTLALKLKLSTNEASTAKVTATFVKTSHHKKHTITLLSSSVSFSAAGTRTVTLKPGNAALSTLLRLIKSQHHVKVTITTRFTDLAGNKTTKQTTVTLR